MNALVSLVFMIGVIAFVIIRGSISLLLKRKQVSTPIGENIRSKKVNRGTYIAENKNPYLEVKAFEDRQRIARQQAIKWAQDVLSNPSGYVILDTETTGLEKNDEIISISIINMNGDVLLDTLVKPTPRKRISPEAQSINGLTREKLKDAPTFDKVFPEIITATRGKTVITYNADFDMRMLFQTAKKYQKGIDIGAQCAMKRYAHYFGEWAEWKEDFKWQRLPGATHNSLGDCLATLNLIKMMVDSNNFDDSEELSNTTEFSFMVFQPEIEQLPEAKIGDYVNFWSPNDAPNKIFIYLIGGGLGGGLGKLGLVPKKYTNLIAKHRALGLPIEPKIIGLTTYTCTINCRLVQAEEVNIEKEKQQEEIRTKLRTELMKPYRPRKPIEFSIDANSNVLTIGEQLRITQIPSIDECSRDIYSAVIVFVNNDGKKFEKEDDIEVKIKIVRLINTFGALDFRVISKSKDKPSYKSEYKLLVKLIGS